MIVCIGVFMIMELRNLIQIECTEHFEDKDLVNRYGRNQAMVIPLMRISCGQLDNNQNINTQKKTY